jgi:O-antigen ligase
LRGGAFVRRHPHVSGEAAVAEPRSARPGAYWLRQGTCLVCLVLPWINPFAGGPSATVQPWLASAICAALLLALRAWQRPGFPPALWIAFACFAVAARWPLSLEAVALFSGLLLVLAMAGVPGQAPREPFLRVMAAGWLAAALLSAVFALLQYFGASDALAPWVSGAALGEAYGNLRQRNQLASLMAIGLASLFWFVRQGWTMRQAVGPLLLLAAGSAASASRTGALQWLVLTALLVVWRGPRQRVLLGIGMGGLAAYAALSAVLPVLLTHLSGIGGASLFSRFGAEAGCGSRRVLWSNVLHLISLRPWTGWGWGELDYAHYMTLYPGARFCDILDNAHSLPLHLAVELGIPVAVVVCGALVWALMRIAPWRESDPARQLALAVLAVILLHSLLEYPLWYGPFQLAFGLSLGVLWPGRQRVELTVRAALACALVATAALCALAYATWDYHRVSQIYLAPEARDPDYRADPLAQLQQSRLFRVHVRFAELTLTPLTRANAQWTYDTALDMLHYSPEPRVVEKVIESALLLGHDDVVMEQVRRYRAAFPKEHAEWAREQGWSGASVPPVKY